ncbi:MAG: hypothetical protein JNN07_14640 [Verrucomicrobiales bacterium]|nr:hypothetical protein [Verrucomicrobiales bacterium]
MSNVSLNTSVSPKKDRPVHEVRLGGVKATVWKNESERGSHYNTTVSRIYRDGETWKTSESFGRDDLLPLAKAIDQAHSWICEQTARRPDAEG